MEIEVGEYVRTKNGLIEKIKIINKFGIVTKHYNKEDTITEGTNYYTENGLEINAEEIMKHSKDIIDLIEAGDYVNGCKVYDSVEGLYIYDTQAAEEYFNRNTRIYFIVVLIAIQDDDFIKTILTKEQYESNYYKVGE